MKNSFGIGKAFTFFWRVLEESIDILGVFIDEMENSTLKLLKLIDKVEEAISFIFGIINTPLPGY